MESNNKITELRKKLEEVENKIENAQGLMSALNDVQLLVSDIKGSLNQLESVFLSVMGNFGIPNITQTPPKVKTPQQKDTLKKDGWPYKVLKVLASGDKTSTEVFEELQRSGDIPSGTKSEVSSEWNNIRYTLSNLDKMNKVSRTGEKRGSKYSISEEGIEAIKGEEI